MNSFRIVGGKKLKGEKPILASAPKKNRKEPEYLLSRRNIILFFNYVFAPRNENFIYSSIIGF